MQFNLSAQKQVIRPKETQQVLFSPRGVTLLSYGDNQASNALTLVLVLAVLVGIGVWRIHQATGIAPEAIVNTAKNLFFLVVVVGGGIYTRYIQPTQWWSCIFAAVWLCFTPVLNDLGAGYTEEGFGYTATVVGPQWYAHTFWQWVVAIGIALLKPAGKWALEKAAEPR
jgi:hypothetical protein